MANTAFWFSIILILGWMVWSAILLIRASWYPEKANAFLIQSIPGVFTSLGILGTFLGIAIGLYNFDVNNIEGSIPNLLSGMKTAFVTSLFGIFLSIVFSYFVKLILHGKGSRIPVPQSEETRILMSILTDMGKIREEVTLTRTAFIDTNADSTTKMLEGVKKTNDELVLLGKKSSENSEAMVKTLDKNHKLMERKFDEFANMLANANTQSLKEAMEKLVKDFNDTFQELIKGLVDQNFEKLHQSIEALNNWQEQHRTDVDALNNALSKNVGQLNGLASQLEHTYSKTKEFIETTSINLVEITKNTKELVAENGKLAKITQALSEVLVEKNTLIESFEKAIKAMDHLLQATEEFEAVKKQITKWLNREQGIHSAMLLFNEGITQLTKTLKELERIKTEDLRVLDAEFKKRLEASLNTSFAHLDQLIKEYIKYLETRES